MKKPEISLKQLTESILLERKVKRILENAVGMASNVQNQVLALGKELKAAGEDITDEEVQAAMLMAALEDKGNLSNVEPEEVKAIADQVKEARGYKLQEGGAVLQAVEMVGAVLGNVALLNVISKAVEKATGKKQDTSKLAAGLKNISAKIKTFTGLPAKGMEKFFGWIAKKMGGGEAAQKIAGYSGTLLVVLIFMALGVTFFPVLGASPLMVVLSLTGLVGKGFEIVALWKHLKHAISDYKKEKGEGSEKLPDLQPA